MMNKIAFMTMALLACACGKDAKKKDGAAAASEQPTADAGAQKKQVVVFLVSTQENGVEDANLDVLITSDAEIINKFKSHHTDKDGGFETYLDAIKDSEFTRLQISKLSGLKTDREIKVKGKSDPNFIDVQRILKSGDDFNSLDSEKLAEKEMTQTITYTALPAIDFSKRTFTFSMGYKIADINSYETEVSSVAMRSAIKRVITSLEP